MADTPLGTNLDALKEAAKNTTDGISSLSDAVKKLNSVSESLGKGLLEGRSGFDDMTTAAKNFAEVTSGAGGVLSGIIANVPGLEGVGSAIGGVFDIVSSTMPKALNEVSELTKAGIEFGDSFSKSIRSSDSEFFGLTKSFGLGVEAARTFTDSLPEEALSDLGRSMYLTTGELKSFLLEAKGSNISMSQLSQSVATAYGEMKFYTLATAQASAAGMSASEGMRTFDNLISKQGMSLKQASETMAGFSKISEETGINISTVVNTLNSAISSFTKLGMTADFGRPILENFAKTVKDVGLGIDVATDATSSLVSAMGGLADNYGLAYLTQMRGGGGATGGLLGTSIQMRQNLREAEQTGGQGAMAIEMGKQIKEAIASMTGGNIVTLKQAASSPELQNQFYMQEQMLAQYGIRDTGTQDAVLDLLARMDKATSMGDSQGQMELAKQLSKEIEGRDDTKDEMEKLQTSLGSLEAAFVDSTREFGNYTRELIAKTGRKLVEGTAEEVVKEGTEKMNQYTAGLDRDVAANQKEKLFRSLTGEKGPLDVDRTKTDVGGGEGVDLSTLPEKDRTFLQIVKDVLKEALVGKQAIEITLSPDAQKWFAASSGLNISPGTPPSGSQ